MKTLSIFLAVFLAAAIAAAGEEAETLSGKITSIDLQKKTLGISGVTIIAKNAEVRGLLMSSRFSRLKAGVKVDVTGKFSGPRRFTATWIEKKVFEHFEINALLGTVNAKDRTLDISGVTVKVPPSCEIQDIERENMPIELLPVGKMIEVEGNWTGDAEFTAYKIEVHKPEAEEKEDEGKEKD